MSYIYIYIYDISRLRVNSAFKELMYLQFMYLQLMYLQLMYLQLMYLQLMYLQSHIYKNIPVSFDFITT